MIVARVAEARKRMRRRRMKKRLIERERMWRRLRAEVLRVARVLSAFWAMGDVISLSFVSCGGKRVDEKLQAVMIRPSVVEYGIEIAILRGIGLQSSRVLPRLPVGEYLEC